MLPAGSQKCTHAHPPCSVHRRKHKRNSLGDQLGVHGVHILGKGDKGKPDVCWMLCGDEVWLSARIRFSSVEITRYYRREAV